ncbi:hypothetical protein ACS127_09125 [Amphibacillus sp. Q70]|uniref:hypothetical protein n=1 Tax=Amphibacillus sp. Q70 TaxID=3453416 RepID=UPI003F87844F
MKKLLKLLAVGFVSIGLLAACDGDVEDPADPGVDDDPAVDDSVDEPGDEPGGELEDEPGDELGDEPGDELEDEDEGF